MATALPSVGWPPTGLGSRRSIRFACYPIRLGWSSTSNGAVRTVCHPAYAPTSGGGSSTSVPVPGRVGAADMVKILIRTRAGSKRVHSRFAFTGLRMFEPRRARRDREP
jgi:hypothetical protein